MRYGKFRTTALNLLKAFSLDKVCFAYANFILRPSRAFKKPIKFSLKRVFKVFKICFFLILHVLVSLLNTVLLLPIVLKDV